MNNIRAELEATVKEWRKQAQNMFLETAQTLNECADTLEHLISQHTGEGQVTDEMVLAAKRVLFDISEDCDDDVRKALEAALSAASPVQGEKK